jgi:large subunit ribosomal protein L2
VATVRFTDGSQQRFLAAEGTFVGSEVAVATKEVRPGNVLRLSEIPESTPVYNIEAQPGDGGKFVRAAGTMATVIGRTPTGVTIRLPSGRFKTMHVACRATVGVVAGGGRGDKPFVKAGKAHHAHRSSGKMYPRTRGVAKNPVDHPHGGGNAHRAEGKSTTLKRGTPPGRNVGHIAAKRTGKRKG